MGPEAFHARLKGIDPESAGRLHPNDTRRIVRVPRSVATNRKTAQQLGGTKGRLVIPRPLQTGVIKRVPKILRPASPWTCRAMSFYECIDSMRVDTIEDRGWAGRGSLRCPAAPVEQRG